jgi:Leucine-rich repeat (LRR) protein
MYCTRLSDCGIRLVVRKCPNLRSLDVSDTAMSDKGLMEIADLASLEELKADSTYVVGMGLRGVAERCTRLRYLDLDRTQLVDKYVTVLANCGRLERLSLSGTNISNAAVPALGSIRKLKFLCIWGTSIDRVGASQLRRALPHCEIVASQ